jgi:hypothetical protein
MSGVIPAEVALELYEGSTFDDLLVFEVDGEPLWTDPTGWDARLQVRRTHDASDAILDLQKIASIGDPPTTSGLVFDVDGALRRYVTDEVMTALKPTDFIRVVEEGRVLWTASWDLELENPDGERSRYLMGTAYLYPEVTR